MNTRAAELPPCNILWTKPVTVLHELKADPEGFQQVWDMRKRCEIRKDDRNFHVGDHILLMETRYSAGMMNYLPERYPLEFTGRQVLAQVTHVQKDYGLLRGWVCLSFEIKGKDT